MTNDQRSSRRNPRTAFTLVELLVVITIIALLISILLPSLKNARHQSKTVKCLSNLKQIMTAGLLYGADDPNENVIPAHPRVDTTTGGRATQYYEWGGKAGRGDSFGGISIVGDPLAFMQSIYGTRFDRGPADRPLNRYLYKEPFTRHTDPGIDGANYWSDANKDLDIFNCPGDDGWQGGDTAPWQAYLRSGMSSYDHFGTSYTMNAAFARSGACESVDVIAMAAFLRPQSRVPNPAKMIIYMENAARYSYQWNYGIDEHGQESAYYCNGARPPYYEETFGGWHGKDWVFNQSFLDGHAANLRVQGHIKPPPRLRIYPWWRNRQSTWSQFRCVTWRGQDWQLDALPAPPVQTNIACSTAWDGDTGSTVDD